MAPGPISLFTDHVYQCLDIVVLGGAILILVFLIPMRLSFLFLVFVAWPLALRGFHRD